MIVIERQWESLARMETAVEKAFADPEFQSLQVEITAIVSSFQIELYQLLP